MNCKFNVGQICEYDDYLLGECKANNAVAMSVEGEEPSDRGVVIVLYG